MSIADANLCMLPRNSGLTCMAVEVGADSDDCNVLSSTTVTDDAITGSYTLLNSCLKTFNDAPTKILTITMMIIVIKNELPPHPRKKK